MQWEAADSANARAVTDLMAAVRHRLGLTQEQMTERLRINCPRHVQSLEYGEKQPSLELFLRELALADAPTRAEFLNRLCWPGQKEQKSHLNSPVGQPA